MMLSSEVTFLSLPRTGTLRNHLNSERARYFWQKLPILGPAVGVPASVRSIVMQGRSGTGTRKRSYSQVKRGVK
jgi:hypothetical protein